MSSVVQLPRSFFARSTLLVARDLLGTRLVRLEGKRRLAGYITEVEAYIGEEDLGCHARTGPTPRNQVMYGPPGYAYVYFTYGMHWMLNIVTEGEGFPAAVLLRGLFPTQGVDLIAARRKPQPRRAWTNGPAKICQAFNIDRSFNGLDLCSPQSSLFLEPGLMISEINVTKGPRVGLNNIPEPWKSVTWRFYIRDLIAELRLQGVHTWRKL